MSANIISKIVGGIRSEQNESVLEYVNDLISLYKQLMDKIEKSLSTIDAYYIKISKLKALGMLEGKIAEMNDKRLKEMFRRSKIRVLENRMNREPEIQEYANYINETLKNDKLAKKLGLRFDEKIATAENTMNNYIILKKCRRELIKLQNTHKR